MFNVVFLCLEVRNALRYINLILTQCQISEKLLSKLMLLARCHLYTNTFTISYFSHHHNESDMIPLFVKLCSAVFSCTSDFCSAYVFMFLPAYSPTSAFSMFSFGSYVYIVYKAEQERVEMARNIFFHMINNNVARDVNDFNRKIDFFWCIESRRFCHVFFVDIFHIDFSLMNYVFETIKFNFARAKFLWILSSQLRCGFPSLTVGG